MRLTSNFARTALTGVAALALLTACGGGNSDDASSSTSAAKTTSSAPTTSTAPTGADAAFCAAVPQLTSQLTAAQSAQPAQAFQLLQQLGANFTKITPPAALQSDWTTLGTGLQQLVTSAGSLDLSSAQGQQQFQQLAGQATSAAAGPLGDIQAWMLSNCGSSSATSSVSAATTS